MTNYERGFIDFCKQAGLDPTELAKVGMGPRPDPNKLPKKVKKPQRPGDLSQTHRLGRNNHKHPRYNDSPELRAMLNPQK